jgi:hypothetical protein
MSTIIARRPKSSYSAAPEGLHAAVCVDVVDLGIVQGAYGAKHKVRVVWQLDVVDETHGRRFDVARAYTLSLHERAALRKDLESWRGKRFTEQELDCFDLEKLLGAPAQVAITHSVADDGTVYANVSTVVPPVKGTPRLVPLDFVRWKDRAPVRTNGNGAGKEDDHDVVPF